VAVSETPAVGNVLGFSLLFRDRKALLTLEQRTLQPGVQLRGYEAEVPNVQFPMRAPVSAAVFRHHRCRALHFTLDADLHALAAWVAARLEGRRVGAIHVASTMLSAAEAFANGGPAWPCLTIEGRDDTGAFAWLRWGLELRPQGRFIEVLPGPCWAFGHAAFHRDATWADLAAALGDGALKFDPGWNALVPAFVASGWKAPDLHDLEFSHLAVGADRLELTLSANAVRQVTSIPADASHGVDMVAEVAERVRELAAQRRHAEALPALQHLVEQLDPESTAGFAATRWLAEYARHLPADIDFAPAVALDAIERWLARRPDDALACRWQVELLARTRAHARLVEVTHAHASTDALARARRDVAIAGLQLRKLDDRKGAADLLRPWWDAIETDDRLAALRVPAARVLAVALVDEPDLAVARTADALRGLDDADERTALRIEVAEGLSAAGHAVPALHLLKQALAETPSDPRLVDAARRLATTLGADNAAVDLLRWQLRHAADNEAPKLRRELALQAAAADARDALALVRTALAEGVRDGELLQAAVKLEVSAGDLDAALEHLDLLRDRAPNGRAEAAIRWQRAQLLQKVGRVGEVWAELWPALSEIEGDLQAEAFEMAIEFAPSAHVDAWVRRLRPRSDPGHLIEALLQRWRRWQIPDAGAEVLLRELTARDRTRDAIAFCREVAKHCESKESAAWLTRAASLAPPEAAAALIEEALEAAPDDVELADRLIDLLRQTGQTARLVALWRRQAEDESLPLARRLESLDRLIARKLGSRRDPIELAAEDGELVTLYRKRTELQPDDPVALLIVGHDDLSAAEEETGVAALQRALELLPSDDPRGASAAFVLGERAAEAGDHDLARTLLERAVDTGITGAEHPVWPLLRRVAEALQDEGLRLRLSRIRLEHAATPSERAAARVELAGIHRRAGRPELALACLADASHDVEVGSPQHLEIAEAWLELSLDQRTEPHHEAEARAELRRALGADLPAAELRTEALLVAERLDDPTRAMDLLEQGLARHRDDGLLLSTLKQIAFASGQTARYLGALHAAVADLAPGTDRDALLGEQATAAVELDDPAAALDALDRLSGAAAEQPEMLDLRDWAVHKLGREDDELRAVGDRLRISPDDKVALARLQRVKGDDAAAVTEHLLGLATEGPPEVAAQLTALALQQSRLCADGALLRRALRRAVDARSDADVVHEAWLAAVEDPQVLADEAALGDVLALAHQAADRSPGWRDQVEAQLDRALARFSSGRLMHRLLWEWSEQADPERTLEVVRARIDRIIARDRLSALPRAELYIGLAEQLDRRRAATLLRQRAEAELGEPAAVQALSDALGERGHVPEQLVVLELAVSRAETDDERVDALKRLAHVCETTLRDSARAIEHLQQALEIAPTDPDLLLPLLEQCYAERQLSRAITLTHRVLEHVPMGDAAYLTLAHRAADAALAQGDQHAAMELLQRAVERVPDDPKTKARLDELEVLKDDPEYRVKLFATVAQRQSGEARYEALEERARLLVDPLRRVDEAISELETVLAESPRRTSAFELLRELYARAERWRDLVALLEGEFPRQHGVQRCQTLREIAAIYRDRLMDLPRAEQALRIALDHLGDETGPVRPPLPGTKPALEDPAAGYPAHRELAEAMRTELVEDLEGQGRYVDLSIYLERALAPEIDGTVALDGMHPVRAELLTELARIYRGPLDDEIKAGRIYERLEHYGRLPDEGLATLARTYHRAGRHEDLVRILNVRSRALEEAGEVARKAAVDQRIAELLEGPLARPHEAATHYLDAYLANPNINVAAGARARVLLSGTDAVPNVRRRLLERLPKLPAAYRPALLTLLGDVLGPHDDYEKEAEERYLEALEINSDYAPAREAVGRLLARQGRLAQAVDPLIEASRHPDIEASRAAEDAAIAARALLELERPEEAEDVLKDALHRAPDSQRALLELARLYERMGRTTEQAIVLENLSQLPLSSMLGAEVAFRRATLLMPATRDDPYCPEAERARAYLLEAVSADAKHVAARQTLLELAKGRLEWSIVAHMHYLAIRELPPGSQRALHHLDLAETYLDHLDDTESAIRNIESAATQAPDELMVSSRVGKIAARLPDPRRVAERFERIASTTGDLPDSARARLWLLAADLRMNDDDPAAAEAASQQVLGLTEAPQDATQAAARNLEILAGDEARELRQQKSGLLKLLAVEEQSVERLHILGRLREVGQSLGDQGLVEWASREQLELAETVDGTETDLEQASAALREVYAERGSYDEIVELYVRLAESSNDPDRKAAALLEAARFCWHGLRAPGRAIVLLRKALALKPDHPDALSMLGEVTRQSEDPELESSVYRELQDLPARQRSPHLDLQLAGIARNLGRDQEAIALLRPLCVQTRDADLRFEALRQLDAVLSRTGAPADRLPILRRYLEESVLREDEEVPRIALELAECERTLGDPDGARRSCEIGLERDASHRGLLRLKAQLLELAEDWEGHAKALERLASVSLEPITQADHLVAAARVRLERMAGTGAARQRTRATTEARRMLIRACEIAPRYASPRLVLLPLSFAEARWDEVLELAIEVRELAGDDEDVLILAALTQAHRHGQRSLARDLGFRHSLSAHERYLYPGLRQLLTEVAVKGPLPRLDALLAGASSLCGGRIRLAEGLRRWAAGRPVQAGLALGLARLAEADGRADTARSLYQIAAFMAPDGPVPGLVARLPLAPAPTDLDPVASGPMEGRSVLRQALVRLRESLAGITEEERVTEPPTEAAKTRVALADSIVAPWRRALGLALPIVWSSRKLAGGVGVRNSATPSIALGSGVAVAAVPELRFRLARATATIMMGLSVLEDGRGRKLEDLLDALGRVANPGHVPTGASAHAIADSLSQRGSVSAHMQAAERAALADELAHWLTEARGVDRLALQLRRAQMLFATRLSGQLDGALLALAHDMGFVAQGRPDPVATLRHDDAHWLLRALGMY
jgi:tetratricopeptide (TPR) repeat protein